MDLEELGQESVSAGQSDMPVSAAQSDIPIIEVSFGNGMWWSLPSEMSAQLYEKFTSGENAGYTWDWGDAREGSWRPDGECTSINRYIIDFTTMTQTNLDNKRKRSVRIVWTTTAATQPQWSGEIPEQC